MIGNFIQIPDYMILISKQSLADSFWRILELSTPKNYANYLQQSEVPHSFNAYNNLKTTTIDIITKIMLKLHFLSLQFGGEQINKAISDNPIYSNIINKVELFKSIIPIVEENNT